jgi:hypothetical protein
VHGYAIIASVSFMRASIITRWLKITPRGVRLRALTRIPGAIRAAKIALHGFRKPFRKLI